MYYHIEKAKYLKISVEKKTFKLLHNRKLLEINLQKTENILPALKEHEFIRAVWNDCYIDLAIARIIETDNIVVKLGCIIDYYKPHN